MHVSTDSTTDAEASAALVSRRIRANLFLTLDGIMEAPERWHGPYMNDEMGAAIGAGFAETDTLLMGGTLYREWSQYWPASRDQPVAGIINATPKYVLSDKLPDTLDWDNSTVLRSGPGVSAVRDLKARPGRTIAVSGSASVVRWLLANSLLDELHLLVCPVVVGSGRRLFGDSTASQPLELVDAERFRTGVLHLTYRPAPPPPPAVPARH